MLAHRGHYADLFPYGSNTDSDWPRRDLQVCSIHAPNTGTGGLDVDRSDEYLADCPLAAFIRPEHAVSRRGDQHWHAVIDMRGVPRDQWPSQGPIPGGDLKTNGFLPVPGSWHWSEEKYEPVIGPGGRITIVPCTPEILAAMHASRAMMAGTGAGGNGGSGGGHDGEVAAQVLGWVRQAVNAGRDPADPAVKGEIYQRWLSVAVPQDPGWPFELEDFQRHYGTAVAKVAATPAPAMSPEVKAWAASTVPAAPGSAPATASVPAAGGKPPRPGLDPLVSRVLGLYTFARDVGGELFLLPRTELRAEPWIPRSFLTKDVINLGHVIWRAMAGPDPAR